jgi:hypothetical protein
MRENRISPEWEEHYFMTTVPTSIQHISSATADYGEEDDEDFEEGGEHKEESDYDEVDRIDVFDLDD